MLLQGYILLLFLRIAPLPESTQTTTVPVVFQAHLSLHGLCMELCDSPEAPAENGTFFAHVLFYTSLFLIGMYLRSAPYYIVFLFFFFFFYSWVLVWYIQITENSGRNQSLRCRTTPLKETYEIDLNICCSLAYSYVVRWTEAIGD